MVTLTCDGCGGEARTHDAFPHRVACSGCGASLDYPVPDSSQGRTPVNQSRYKGATVGGNAFAKNNEGLRYLNAREYQAAVSAFTEAIDLQPGFVGAYRSRASAYQGLGMEEQARLDLEKFASIAESARSRRG